MSLNSYIMVVSCDFENYCLEVKLSALFSNIEEAEQFISADLMGIELSKSGVSFLANSGGISTIKFMGSSFMELRKNAFGKPIVNSETDYRYICDDFYKAYAVLKNEFANKKTFFFSVTAYSIDNFSTG